MRSQSTGPFHEYCIFRGHWFFRDKYIETSRQWHYLTYSDQSTLLVWSGSTLFVIPSAYYKHITALKTKLSIWRHFQVIILVFQSLKIVEYDGNRDGRREETSYHYFLKACVCVGGEEAEPMNISIIYSLQNSAFSHLNFQVRQMKTQGYCLMVTFRWYQSQMNRKTNMTHLNWKKRLQIMLKRYPSLYQETVQHENYQMGLNWQIHQFHCLRKKNSQKKGCHWMIPRHLRMILEQTFKLNFWLFCNIVQMRHNNLGKHTQNPDISQIIRRYINAYLRISRGIAECCSS